MADGPGEFAGASAGSAHSSRDKAFEIFVKRTITGIQKEAWGRSKEVKEIREACQTFLNTLDQTGCTEETLKQVLYPLQLACASSMQKVVELALGCLHKLVAHAWLHGESTASGTMDILSAHGSLDDDDTVANVIKMVIKCGETSNEALQLAVVRALLTFTTAEHFVAHGECLLSAVRAVFNLALGADNPINKRTACNALLQMLNTICKRVTQIQPRLTGSSECSSRTASDAYEMFRSLSGVSFYNSHSPRSNRGSGCGVTALGYGSQQLTSPTAAAAAAAAGGGSANNSHHGSSGMLSAAAGGSGYLATAAGQQQLLAYEIEAAAAAAAADANSAAAHARAMQLAQLAERKDLQGLEAALEASSGGTDDQDDDDNSSSQEEAADRTASATSTSAAAAAAAAAAALVQAGKAAEGTAGPPAADGAAVQTQPSVGAPAGQQQLPSQLQSQVSCTTPRAHRHHGHRSSKLTTQEKDVLLVLTAFCKLASREAPGNAGDNSVLAQGKLLALEMLAKVLSSSYHNWDHVSETFCRQLRQPLCLALLRNCAASDPGAYALALRLLMAILCLPRLRMGLRAELGAFYPLLVLRVLEQQAAPGAAAEAANVASALGALQGLLAEPQLLVDLYVNFDCDLQASNLYERTVQVLSKLAVSAELEGDGGKADKRTPEAVAAAAAVRKDALACCLQVINALESWARPIKEAALRAAESDVGAPAGNGVASFPSLPSMERDGSQSSLSSLTSKAPPAASSSLSEAERLAAAKSTKELLAKGINTFNSKGPLKGLDLLIANGLVDSSPAAVAAFLRSHCDQLDKAALGELLGHHDDFALAVMHAWVDSEPGMAGQAIDQSLRRLLGGFRLPGEAQKIDRIMEKFAERYCKDNPSRFSNADAAYVLSFAIIMLNTDAHNPLAERRLAKADFVAMNHQASEEGGMQPVLPVAQLEEIYERVVRDEILVRGEAANSSGFATSRTSTRNRLAAAMGWTSLLQPFRALAGGSGSKGGKGDSSSAVAHRRYLQEMAEREVVRASASGNVWCCASHPEHVRPMLQVGGPMLQHALSAGLAAARDPAAAAPLLAALLQLAKLSGLLGLDRQCESCVAVLAANCGAFAPAPAGSAGEAKQLAVLQALLGLTAGPEAGFLGSSWVIVLRCVSALDALKHELTRPVSVPTAPAAKEPASSNPFSRMFQSMFGASSNSREPQAPSTPVSSMGGAGGAGGGARFSLTGSTEGGAGPNITLGGGIAGSDAVLRDSLDGSKRICPAIRDAPGAGLVQWAESAAGSVELERAYTRSTSLDGDAVIVFMRALCAVSQEELEAGSSSTAAAAASTPGDGRPSSSGGSGPVSTPGSAAAAAAAALSAGGVGPRLFSLQKVVECAYHNMTRIRLVWHKLWAVIAAQLVGASCHPNRRVALYAVDSLRQLVAKLLARAELEHFTHQEDALRPFVAVLRQCDEPCVRELAVQCVMQAVNAHPSGLGSGWRMVTLALRLGAADGSPAVMAQTQEALQLVVETLYCGGPQGGPGGHTFLRETVQAIVAGIRNPAHLELSISAVQLLGRCGQQLAAYEDAGGTDEPPAAAVAAAPGGVDLDGDYGWGLLLRTLADVLQHDRRPPVVDAALEMVFGLLARFSARWDAPAWRVLIQRVVKHMLALPPALSASLQPGGGGGAARGSVGGSSFSFASGQQGTAGGGGGMAGSVLFAAGAGGGAGGAVPAGLSASEQAALMTTLLQRMDRYYPMLCEQAVLIRREFKVDLVQQLAAIGVAWYQQNSVYLSTAGIKALMRLAETLAHIPATATAAAAEDTQQGGSTGTDGSCGWQLLLSPVAAAVKADVELVAALARQQLAATAQQPAAPAGSKAAGGRLAAAGGSGSPGGSPRATDRRSFGASGSFSSTGSGSSSSLLGQLKGGAAARQAEAAAVAAQMQVQQLRVRSRQLVLMQRGLAEVYQQCRASMTWPEQMQLLEVLGLGVEAAIAFNADLAAEQQRRQRRRLGMAAAGATAGHGEPEQPSPAGVQLQQSQQQAQAALLNPVPEHQQLEKAGSISDSLSLASAVSRNSSISMSGLAGFGSYVTTRAVSGELSGGGSFVSGTGSLGSFEQQQQHQAAAAGAAAALLSGPGGPLAGSGSGVPDSLHGAASGSLGMSISGSGDGGAAAAAGASGEWAAATAAAAGDDAVAGNAAAATEQPVAEPTAAAAATDSASSLVVGALPNQQQEQQHPQKQQPEQQQQLPALAPVRTQPPTSDREHQQQQQPGSAGSPHKAAGSRLAAVAGSGSGSPAAPGSPGRSRMHGVSLPLLVVSSPESVEEVTPALMRLEAEGGLLLIEALALCLSAPAPPPAAASQARQRLLQLVRRVIQSEAAASTTAGLAWPGSSSSTAAAAAGCPAASSSAENVLQDALAGVTWDHAARAPLVVAALKVLSGLQGQEYHAEVLALFPSLCRLMCSNHLLTRQQLHQVFSSREFVGLLPAAGAGGGASAAAGGSGDDDSLI